MIVKDIMTQEVEALLVDMPADEALRIILEKEMSGLPVVDNQNNLVGMFTETEVLSFCFPAYLNKVGKFIYKKDSRYFGEKISKLRDFKVSQIMLKDIVAVSEEVKLSEALKLLMTQPLRRIPVVKDSKLIGIVSRADIVKQLAKESGILKDTETI